MSIFRGTNQINDIRKGTARINKVYRGNNLIFELVFATFNSNGGTPTYSSQSGPSPLSVTSPGTPTRSGFIFLGWQPPLPTTITSNTTFIADWIGSGGGCYLTTAMVNHYGYDDDGIELNSMRAVRSYMIEDGSEKYITMLKQYAEESNAIVEYIEQQENKEEYYQEIKDVVLQVTKYVKKGKLSEATNYYWKYYLKIKNEVKV